MSKRTALIAALLVSVALNLLVAGVLIGRAGARHPEGPPPGAWAARELSPETRRLVRRHMAEQMESVRPMRSELRRVQGGIRTAVQADPYDPEALKSALEALRNVSNRYQRLLHENLAEIAAELPADEREALVRAALERTRGGVRPGPPGKRGEEGARGDRRIRGDSGEGPPRPRAPGQG